VGAHDITGPADLAAVGAGVPPSGVSQRAARVRFQRSLGPTAAALLLAVAVLLCYANALRMPPGQAASGRPVFNLTLAINHAISGREPWS
jgi:hypothetical protein